MQKLNTVDIIALILVIVGGLNWGFVVFNFNLVDALFGAMPWFVTLVYGLVGLAAIYLAVNVTKLERK